MFPRRNTLLTVVFVGIVSLLITINLLSTNQVHLQQTRNTLANMGFVKILRNLNINIDSSEEINQKKRRLKIAGMTYTDYSSFHRRPQKCKIPVLDPYHPDVKPFIKRWRVPECTYPELSEVTDQGVLKVSFFSNTDR